MSKTNVKTTQADQLMKRWAGRNPDGSRIPGAKPEMSGYKARMILAQSEPYKSNPELAFGCARLLITYNIMKVDDFNWMLHNHPVWSQIMAPEHLEINGKLMDEANESAWGQSHNATMTLEVQGTVELTYEHPTKGVKTEEVTLGFECIRYEGDTRPFIALNLGGGSAIRYHLLKTEPQRPDYKVNNDSDSQRYVKTGKHAKAQAAAELSAEQDLETRAESAMAKLLKGETITLGFGSFDEPTTARPDEDTKKASNSGWKGGTNVPSAYRKK